MCLDLVDRKIITGGRSAFKAIGLTGMAMFRGLTQTEKLGGRKAQIARLATKFMAIRCFAEASGR